MNDEFSAKVELHPGEGLSLELHSGAETKADEIFPSRSSYFKFVPGAYNGNREQAPFVPPDLFEKEEDVNCKSGGFQLLPE